jgi:hypothetical protein
MIIVLPDEIIIPLPMAAGTEKKLVFKGTLPLG